MDFTSKIPEFVFDLGVPRAGYVTGVRTFDRWYYLKLNALCKMIPSDMTTVDVQMFSLDLSEPAKPGIEHLCVMSHYQH